MPEPSTAAGESGARDYSSPLWTLLMFETFLRSLQGAKGTATVSGVAA